MEYVLANVSISRMYVTFNKISDTNHIERQYTFKENEDHSL